VENVLWLDDDTAFMEAHCVGLELAGFRVDRALSLTDGLRKLGGNSQYGLLILDVMIPVGAQEREHFSPEATDNGKLSGLAFYRLFKRMLAERKTEVLVVTVRDEKEVRDCFVTEGLPDRNYVRKSDIQDVSDLVRKVRDVLSPGERQG